MAYMASIRLYDTSTVMRNNFYKAVAYLLPIAKGNKKGTIKLSHGRISQVIATVSAANNDKSGCGPSRIEYHFHSSLEYKKIGED